MQDASAARDVIEGRDVLHGKLFPLFDGPDDAAMEEAATLQSKRRRDEAEKCHVVASGGDPELAAQLRLDIIDAKRCLVESGCFSLLIESAVKRFIEAVW